MKRAGYESCMLLTWLAYGPQPNPTTATREERRRFEGEQARKICPGCERKPCIFLPQRVVENGNGN